MALILVVDDSQDDLILLKEFLLGLGHHCRLATSGKFALDVLSVEKIDLIISDFMMEDGDGIWLLQELKKIIDAPKCILMSSDTQYGVEHFIKSGAAAFCPKPVLWNNLRKEIDRLI